jgi:hypothetical protein
MKPFGSRTHETVCPHRFATGPYHALAPASIAARKVASTSSTQNEISIPGGCACGRTGVKSMPFRATHPASTKASVVSPDEDALGIHLAPLELEYALVERRRLLDVLHVKDRLSELHGAERISVTPIRTDPEPRISSHETCRSGSSSPALGPHRG